MEEKLAKLASLLPTASKIEPIELAPALLVVMVLLTHFSLGFLPVLPGMSYADVMCLGGVAAVMAFLPLSGRLANRETPRHLACALAFLVCIAFMLSKVSGAQWHGFAVLTSSFFAGAFVALGSALWFEHFANRPMESIALSLTCCLVCGAFLAWFLIGMSADRFDVGYCVVAISAGVSLDSSLGGGPRRRFGGARQQAVGQRHASSKCAHFARIDVHAVLHGDACHLLRGATSMAQR